MEVLHNLIAKLLTPTVIWFIILSSYFPRSGFAHKNNKEFIHGRFEKLKNYMPDVPQRISKLTIKNEVIEKPAQTEAETIFHANFSKSIKYWVESFRNNDYVKKIMSPRVINTVSKNNYTLDDDIWLMEIRRFLFDNYKRLEEMGSLQAENVDIVNNPGILSKLDLQDAIQLFEKELYDVITENEKRLNALETRIFEALEQEDMINKLNFDPSDCIADLRLRFPEDDAFIIQLEKKQNEIKDYTRAVSIDPNAAQSKGKSTNQTGMKQPHVYVEDMACQICNDGDYTDDDLIVFCSVSKIDYLLTLRNATFQFIKNAMEFLLFPTKIGFVTYVNNLARKENI